MKKTALLLSLCSALLAAPAMAQSIPDARMVSYQLTATNAKGHVVADHQLTTSASAPALLSQTQRHAYIKEARSRPDGSPELIPGELVSGMGASVKLSSIGADGSSAEGVVDAWVHDPLSAEGLAKPAPFKMSMSLPVSMRVGQPVTLGSKDGVTYALTLTSISAL